MSGADDRPQQPHGQPDSWAPEVAEIRRRQELAQAMGGPDKVERQRASGRLTVRERIGRLADPGSFAEIGGLAGFGDYDADGHLVSVRPANFVAGTARIDGRPVMLGADDFTGRGGSGDAAIHAKQIFSEQYANRMRLPVIRLLDGASGGGSVKMTYEAGYAYLPVNPGWDAVVGNLSLVPVVAAALGPTVGLGAARLVMSHFAVMVTGVGQLFTAGPPVVRSSTVEDLTKEELGGAAVHRRNGTIERFAASEDAAFAMIRSFLSYLPAGLSNERRSPHGDHAADLLKEPEGIGHIGPARAGAGTTPALAAIVRKPGDTVRCGDVGPAGRPRRVPPRAGLVHPTAGPAVPPTAGPAVPPRPGADLARARPVPPTAGPAVSLALRRPREATSALRLPLLGAMPAQ